MKQDNLTNTGYFRSRKVDPSDYEGFQLPAYLESHIQGGDQRILDVGCGYGHLLHAMIEKGAGDVRGVDISDEAVQHCAISGLKAEKIESIDNYASNKVAQFDVIIMSHVLEHIRKDRIVSTLVSVRSMLDTEGRLLIMVPNAQSPSGPYWAYEDFTHTTIFTAGSLFYVLREAGFDRISILDPHCLEDLPWWRRVIKGIFLKSYILNRRFWNRITSSAFHRSSPEVFSYEIKVVAQ